MILKSTQYFLFFFLIFPLLISAQEVDFNEFKTTKSVGAPPRVFTETFQERVDYRKGKVTEVGDKYKDDYVKYSNYSLNGILQSGYVLYGDPMTKFVQKVGSKLLSKHPSLKEELQFFVIKNNMTNALCTDPGVIFITTGLLAQIENEAQLAYVMAHEIVHYQENHLQKSFHITKESEIGASTAYQDLVMLSKDHEFEADAKALKLYHAAGYSDKEINIVFDVLMYSYLTFDEIELDSTFFGNPETFIPSSYFPEKANPILAYEDYDDTKSSHPNIRKRKDAIADELRKYDNWENNKNFIDIDEFINIQNIARFETVRENVILSNYLEALYEIYILEKKFENNEYLQTTKAIVWATMNQASLSGKKNTFLKNAKNKEGSISLLYGFFKTLNQQELSLLTIRQVEDLHNSFPESKIIRELRDETIRNLALVKRFDIKRLEKISYLDALALRDNKDTMVVEVDSINTEGETKYDRIRRIREQQSSSQSTAELIDENFSSFLIYDLVSNRNFNELYEEAEKEREKEKNIVFEKNKAKEEKLKGNIILYNPLLVAKGKQNRFDLDNTMKFYDLVSLSLDEQAPKGRLHQKSIVFSENFTTESYNETSMLTDFILQLSNRENFKFPLINVDEEQMKDFIKEHKAPYLLLIIAQARKVSKTKNDFSAKIEYIDLATGKSIRSSHYSVGLKVRKASVGGLVFEALSKI